MDITNQLTQINSGGIRRFANPYLQSELDATLNSMGPNESIAVVAHGVYESDGTRVEKKVVLTAVYRLPAGFSIVAGGFKDFVTGNKGAEASIVFRR